MIGSLIRCSMSCRILGVDMSRAFGIGATHFFVTEVPYRDGWALCEQGKGNNLFLFSRSRRKLYKARAILNEIWREERKK